MSPTKLDARGIGGCVLAEGHSPYLLKDGTQTYRVALTRSLLRAEPCMRRLADAPPIGLEEAHALGYHVVRSYDDAVMHGLV